MIASIVRADAARLPLAEGSVDCIVASPPYNVGMPYDETEDALPVVEYVARVSCWAREIARAIRAGGRAWINVPQALPLLEPVAPQRWSPALVWHRALEAAGLLFRDWIVWHQVGADAATAWGSHLSPNAPNVRGRYELILLFFKERWNRGCTERNDIGWEQWGPWTQNVWEMPCVTRRRAHLAPFPEELPRRAILLSTWPGDVVLDPFCGSGTTVRVAKDLGRVGIGCELSEVYCRQVQSRCAQEVLLLQSVVPPPT